MWNQLKQLSDDPPSRTLLALFLLYAIFTSALPHFRQGSASVWQLVLDVGVLVAFLLLVLSFWSPAEAVLTRLWEAYYPYVVGILAAFFLSWGGSLFVTSSADPARRYLTLGVGLVFAVAFVQWLREREAPAHSS